MDGFSIAASVIAVVDVSVKVTALCSQYIAAVKDAENDIKLVRKKVEDIIHTLKEIEKLLDRPQNAQLSTTHGLFKSLDQCLQQLKQLEKQLEPRKIRKFLRWIGFQALKWPFTSKQVKDTLSSLESYNQSFSLALNVDQM
jgi:esterase/lipase superfamily enzyme